MVVAALALWYQASRSDPVPESEVVRRFRDDPPTTTHGGPAAGVYLYDVTGRERGGAGPVQVGRDLPRRATLTVTGTDTGWQAETAYSRQHVEASRLERVDGDVVMRWRRVDVSFAGFGRDDRREILGVVRIVRSAAGPGDGWTDHYRTGTLENVVRSRVLRREPVTVGGRSATATVIESVTTTTGALSGTRREMFWWLPDLRLVARSRLQVEIRGVFGYRSTIDATLRSLTPTR